MIGMAAVAVAAIAVLFWYLNTSSSASASKSSGSSTTASSTTTSKTTVVQTTPPPVYVPPSSPTTGTVGGLTYGLDLNGNLPSGVSVMTLSPPGVTLVHAPLSAANPIYMGFVGAGWYYLAAHPAIGMFWCNTSSDMSAISTWFMSP
jgi:hypothetical protein